MITVACCLWDVNANTMEFSRYYDETWVEKLYSGFRRNLTLPFRFVCFTEKPRRLSKVIEQEPLMAEEPGYGCMIEPFRLDVPMIICGLDTIILDNIDHMARYCLEGTDIATPEHPSKPHVTINPIVFVPAGNRHVFDNWNGENDMDWLATQKHIKTDVMWPRQILSYKLHDVKHRGQQDAKIIYFHGKPKPHDLPTNWLRAQWR